MAEGHDGCVIVNISESPPEELVSYPMVEGEGETLCTVEPYETTMHRVLGVYNNR